MQNLFLIDHPCARDHNRQRDKEQDTRNLSENDKGQRHTDERCNGIIRAGLRCTEIPLGVHIEVNAQAVGDETQYR